MIDVTLLKMDSGSPAGRTFLETLIVRFDSNDFASATVDLAWDFPREIGTSEVVYSSTKPDRSMTLNVLFSPPSSKVPSTGLTRRASCSSFGTLT